MIPIDIASLQLVQFLGPSESSISGEEMLRRASAKSGIDLGVSQLQDLLEHQEKIPKEFRAYDIVLPKIVDRAKGDDKTIVCLLWRNEEWIVVWRQLERDWYGHYRFLRLK